MENKQWLQVRGFTRRRADSVTLPSKETNTGTSATVTRVTAIIHDAAAESCFLLRIIYFRYNTEISRPSSCSYKMSTNVYCKTCLLKENARLSGLHIYTTFIICLGNTLK
jgi:hypothetical protein